MRRFIELAGSSRIFDNFIWIFTTKLPSKCNNNNIKCIQTYSPPTHPQAKQTSTIYHISLVAIYIDKDYLAASLEEPRDEVEEEHGQRQVQEVQDRIVGNLEPLLSFLRIRNGRQRILHQNHADSHHIVLHVLLPVQLLHVEVEQLLVPLVELLVKLWHVVVFEIELLVGEEENHVTVLLDLPVQLLNSGRESKSLVSGSATLIE